MKKRDNIKQLQNLFSWKQFYQNNDDIESVEITQQQIEDLQIIIDKQNGNN